MGASGLVLPDSGFRIVIEIVACNIDLIACAKQTIVAMPAAASAAHSRGIASVRAGLVVVDDG